MSTALRQFVLRHLDFLRLDRLLIIDRLITDDLADRLITRILELEARDSTADIVLILDSPGGQLKAGLAIYDALSYTACGVVTVGVEHAASMAALLLAAGTPGKRMALSTARVSLHAPWISTGARESATHDADMKRVAGLAYCTLAQLTGQPLSVIEADAGRRLTLNAVEACAYGFVDWLDGFPAQTAEPAEFRATARR